MLATAKQVAALVNLFKDGTRIAYKKGQYIIRPGESPGSVYYIEEGLVKAFNISKYGEENLLIIRKEGEIFPLIWPLTGDELDINYEALVPTALRRISKQKYLDYLNKEQDALPPLLDMVIDMHRLHSLHILNLGYRSVRERLIAFLLYMCDRFGKEDGKCSLIDVPLKHQDIASSINASRETVTRQIASLERKGLISQKRGGYFTLKDSDALRKYL